MYCSRCATLITEDLNFCSKCGERVNKEELSGNSKKQSEMVDNLAITAIFIGTGGLLFLVGLVAVLLEKSVDPMLVFGIVGLYIAGWLAVCFKLLGQISKLVDANLGERKIRTSEVRDPEQPVSSKAARLDEYHESVMSVTELTTKNLDKVSQKSS